MSLKDKPLKKIVADTRVTIDALHNDIVKDFDKEKQEYNYSVIDESEEEDDNVLDTEVNNIFLKQSDNNLQTNNDIDILSSVIQPRVSNNIQLNNIQVNDLINIYNKFI